MRFNLCARSHVSLSHLGSFLLDYLASRTCYISAHILYPHLHHLICPFCYSSTISHRACRRCYKRETFLQLEERTYKPVLEKVRLHDVLMKLIGRRARIEAPETVVVDETILRLAVHEVATNAAKYGRDGEHIHVEAEFVAGASSGA